MPTPPPTFLDRYLGYTLCLPNGGGKAGKGRNITSSVQVRSGRNGMILETQFKYVLADRASYFDALEEAREWIRAHPLKESSAAG